MPWGLGAQQLAEWLEETWVRSESCSAGEKTKRGQLLRRLSDTDGFELLTACTTEDERVPFVKISKTKNGRALEDSERAKQLTSVLHTQAGLTFYYQLFCVSNSVSPLLDLEWVRLIEYNEDTEAQIVRSRDDPSQLYTIKFGIATEFRRNEEKMPSR